MIVPGISLSDVERRIQSVTPAVVGDGHEPAAGAEERFARAALSALVEPGDRDASVLIAALGAPRALASIVDRWTCERTISFVAVSDSGAAESLTERLPAAYERWRPRVSLQAVVRSLESAARVGALLVTPSDPQWPSGLADLGDGAPIALWVRGEARLLSCLDRSIALVGARAATGYGEHVAMEASAGLSDLGLATVSGGAYGIDGAVHRATLASEGTTIAFLAGGVDRLYPAGHTALLTRIAQNGLLAAELPCGSSPTKWRFLQRNRLIAAASRATIVIEAGRRSGSLNTAGHAAEIGRPLGAVPGPVTSPASAGCHRLIRDFGAHCVTGAAEMAELTGTLEEPALFADDDRWANQHTAETPEAVRLLDALSVRTAKTVDELAVAAGMSTREVISTLGALETDARVRESGGGWVKHRGSVR